MGVIRGSDLGPRDVDRPAIAGRHADVEALIWTWLDVELRVSDTERGRGYADDVAVGELDGDVAVLTGGSDDVAVARVLPWRQDWATHLRSARSITRPAPPVRLGSARAGPSGGARSRHTRRVSPGTP